MGAQNSDEKVYEINYTKKERIINDKGGYEGMFQVDLTEKEISNLCGEQKCLRFILLALGRRRRPRADFGPILEYFLKFS